VKALEDAYSLCGLENLTLSIKVIELITTEKRLLDEVEGLHQYLIDMTLSHHVQQVRND